MFGTQIHPAALVFILLEIGMLIFQVFYYLFRPQDKIRLWHLILLMLMVIFNISDGVFPDPHIKLRIDIQERIPYGCGFLAASYFPFYCYKVFDLKSLHYHAKYGVLLFLMLPYLIFYVLLYRINENLRTSTEIGMVAPSIYELVLLWVIFRAVNQKYTLTGDKSVYMDELGTCAAGSCWVAIPICALFKESQLVQIFCVNIAFVAICIRFIWKSVLKARKEYCQFRDLMINGIRPGIFMENCQKHHLTNREIEIIQLLRIGIRPKEIGNQLFIAERTVTTHLQNVMIKTCTNSRLELIRKLENGIFQ